MFCSIIIVPCQFIDKCDSAKRAVNLFGSTERKTVITALFNAQGSDLRCFKCSIHQKVSGILHLNLHEVETVR